MPHFTLLYGARQLLTLRGPSGARRGSHLQELAIIENGSILIENGLIHSLGSTRRIENLKEAKSALVIDVSGSIVMPGLVDPDVTVLHGGLASGRKHRPARVYDDTLALMRSCLQQGTVSAVLKASGGTNGFDSDISLLRQFQKIGSNPVDTVKQWNIAGPPADESEFGAFEAALKTLLRRRLLDCISISAAGSATPFFRPYLARVMGAGLPVDVRWAGGTVEDAHEVVRTVAPRAISCPSSLTRAEIEMLAGADAVAVFAPGSDVGRSSGPGLRQLVDAGGAVALASGCHPVHSPGFSMQMAISLATIHGGLSAEEAICAATVNAAHAAGCRDVGTIEKGKRAHLLVLNISDYRQIPRQFGINHVSTVLKDGEVVLNRAGWKMGSSAAAVGRMRSEYI